MKIPVLFAALLSTAALVRAESAIETSVTGLPAGTTEVLFSIDVVAPAETGGYEEPAPAAAVAAPAAPLVAIPPAPGQPAAPAAAPAAPAPQQQKQGGGRRRGPAAPPFTARGTAKPEAGGTAHWKIAAPAGSNYRVRAIAIKGEDTFPIVVAGGKALGVKVEADKTTTASIAVAAPSLQLAADNPTTVAAGSHFKLAGVLKDPGSFLGTKNRMRVWMNSGTAPTANQSGTQVSTVDVETTDDDVKFNLELTAPRETGPLFVQFGELSLDFNRADGKQAPVIVVPDLSSGGKPVQLTVGPAKVASDSGR